MDTETVRAKMDQYIAPARGAALAQACGWSFDLDGLRALVTLKHRRKPECTHVLRVTFEEFPRRAPSYVFVDPKTKEITAGAWPPNVKYDGNPPGICTPGTREFHENYHANDAQYSWDPARYTFTDTLLRIQQLMERGIGG
jgi:hypothetical protein